jgi:hypothetical protein
MDLQHTTNRHQDPPCERTRFVFPNDLGSRACVLRGRCRSSFCSYSALPAMAGTSP